MTARARKRFLICVLLGLGIGGIFSLAFSFGFFSGLNNVQNLVTDTILFRSRDGVTAEKVVMMQIDEPSVSAFKEQYGRVFSWPRTLHAQALRNVLSVVPIVEFIFGSGGKIKSGSHNTHSTHGLRHNRPFYKYLFLLIFYLAAAFQKRQPAKIICAHRASRL